MNPLLPFSVCVPDAEAHPFDGRLYLYGSFDLPGRNAYCSDRYHVYSTDDMQNFTDHGVSFQTPDFLYAPDCARIGDRYCLYYCGPNGIEGMADSASPAGPFTDRGLLPGISGSGIDPAVFVDDDGQIYYFWGQFQLCGVRLKEDGFTPDQSTYHACLLDEYRDGFHEGSSIRKRGQYYYLVYTDISRGRATCLSYAMSEHPLGPYEKKGVIIDNLGCDPYTWNDHGSIEEFHGQWYVFYHRSTRCSGASRCVCCEKIDFDENGLLREAEMTTQGPEPPIPAGKIVEGWRFCFQSGRSYACDDNDAPVCRMAPGDWVTFRYFDLPKKQYKLSCTFRNLQANALIAVSWGSFRGQHDLAMLTPEKPEAVITFTDEQPSKGRQLYFTANMTVDLVSFVLTEVTP